MKSNQKNYLEKHLLAFVIIIAIIITIGIIVWQITTFFESEQLKYVENPQIAIYEDNSTIPLATTQLLPNFPDGTKFVQVTDENNNKLIRCQVDTDPVISDNLCLGIGIVIAAVATGIGIILTWKDRKNERNKRNQEIIQL